MSEAPKLKLVPKPGPKWYELDGIVPYRDPIGLVGFLLAIGGIGVFSVAAALIVAGLGLLSLSVLMSLAVVKAKPAKEPERKPHVSM